MKPWHTGTILAGILLIFLFPSCKREAPVPSRRVVHAEEGMIDVADAGIHEGKLLHLQGEWEFYWRKFIDPESPGEQPDGYIKLPGLWSGYILEGKKLPGDGYASFRLRMSGLRPGERYGVKIKEMDTAYALWIDGEKAAAAGNPGSDEASSVPSWKRSCGFFTAASEGAEIVLYMSNYHHRKGGPEEVMLFGLADRISRFIHRRISWEAFLGGAVFLMCLYNLILYLFRRSDKSPLLLSLSCILIVLRIFFTGEKLVLTFFPSLPWNVLIKLEYIDLYLLAPIIGWFYRSIFPGNVKKLPVRVVGGISSLFIVLTLITKPKVFTHLLPAFQTVFFLFGLYILFIMMRRTVQKQDGSLLLTIGTALLLLFGINDFLYNNLILPYAALSPMGIAIGLLLFLLSHAAFLARRFAKAYETAEELSVTLDKKVRERTSELEKEKEKFLKSSREDALTGLCNRRYVFDLLQNELQRFKRYGSRFSIIIFDLDHFKWVNDNYGHLSGDMVLKAFAETLRQLIRDIDTPSRIGGEEFLVLLPETGGEAAFTAAEKIRASFECISFDNLDNEFRCTCSAGIAEIGPRHFDINDLIKEADVALYKAKETGRNKVLSA